MVNPKKYMQLVDQDIQTAIKKHQGEELQPGDVCAHPSDKTIYSFVRYEGDDAVLILRGVEKRFPRAEIFNPQRVQQAAMQMGRTIN